jgi:hypothetical protein
MVFPDQAGASTLRAMQEPARGYVDPVSLGRKRIAITYRAALP